MTPAERYLHLAADLRARAEREESMHLAAQWESLSQCYLRLAEQAEHSTGPALHPILQSQPSP